LRYKLLRYKLHVFAAFRTADHDVTPRNCTDSKDNPYNDENDMGDWHDVCIFTVLLFCLFISFHFMVPDKYYHLILYSLQTSKNEKDYD